MDYLKVKAPFWKKEQTEQGERWVEAKQKDQQLHLLHVAIQYGK